MSLDLDLLCVGALAHPITLSQLYLHLFNKALWCLTDMTRLARCDINCQSVVEHLQLQVSSAGCRMLLLGFRLQLAWVLQEQQIVVLWDQWVLAVQLLRLREW